jgi:hypothetical protein
MTGQAGPGWRISSMVRCHELVGEGVKKSWRADVPIETWLEFTLECWEATLRIARHDMGQWIAAEFKVAVMLVLGRCRPVSTLHSWTAAR